MIAIKFNNEAAISALRSLRARLADMTPVYRDIGEYMVKATRDRFIAGTDPDGKAWAPKKQSTIDKYQAQGDGLLTSPLIGPSRRLGREIFPIVARSGVQIGSSLIYAAVMQLGAAKGAFGTSGRGQSIPWGTIPARPYLGISADDEANILDIVAEWLEGAVDGGGEI